jgi:hypothetical protein|tara:strand:+ start:3048 stop:4211 length:1164 start_codon:yes stop_codon:yes gene_type:complete
MRKLFFIVLSILCLSSYSQHLKLTNNAEISVITCGPGTELYTAFGHSAFRVRDTTIGVDKIYNYGTFDFDQPNFYGNFAKGNLLYFLNVTETSRFLRVYYHEKRWVKGQVLDLIPADTQKFYDYLENNTLPENREYLYDYFFNNCSTKLFDVVNDVLGTKLVKPELFANKNLTHRELMQLYLGDQPWGDFGIDLCLGSVIDRKATANEYLFLPDNVFTYFDSLKINQGFVKPLIKRTETILAAKKTEEKKSLITPLLFFSIIGMIVIWTTLRNIKRKKRSRILDFGLFFITGVIGLVITLIWFATNHISAENNFNVLWAFAPNLFVSFYYLKKQIPNWLRKYSLITFVLIALNILLWILKVQIFSIAIIPILMFLGVRYYFLWKYTY